MNRVGRHQHRRCLRLRSALPPAVGLDVNKTTSFFHFGCGIVEACINGVLWNNQLFIDKKYALPYRVLDGLVAHFIRFNDDSREMPVSWHQCLLVFVQRYKNELQKEDKDKLKKLMEKQLHRLITPEVLRELDESRNRGEKEDDAMLITSPISVINKTIVENRFDVPDVPMEEA